MIMHYSSMRQPAEVGIGSNLISQRRFEPARSRFSGGMGETRLTECRNDVSRLCSRARCGGATGLRVLRSADEGRKHCTVLRCRLILWRCNLLGPGKHGPSSRRERHRVAPASPAARYLAPGTMYLSDAIQDGRSASLELARRRLRPAGSAWTPQIQTSSARHDERDRVAALYGMWQMAEIPVAATGTRGARSNAFRGCRHQPWQTRSALPRRQLERVGSPGARLMQASRRSGEGLQLCRQCIAGSDADRRPGQRSGILLWQRKRPKTALQIRVTTSSVAKHQGRMVREPRVVRPNTFRDTC